MIETIFNHPFWTHIVINSLLFIAKEPSGQRTNKTKLLFFDASHSHLINLMQISGKSAIFEILI